MLITAQTASYFHCVCTNPILYAFLLTYVLLFKVDYKMKDTINIIFKTKPPNED